MSGDAAGDTNVTIAWSNPSDLGTGGGVNVYFDPNGCAGGTADGGTGTSAVLTPGTVPPASARVYTQLSSSITSTSVAAATLGWTSATHGQRGAIAVTVMDNARNTSVLSNVVCVEHVVVTGFWEQYCAAHGMPDIAQCTANYHGCSVGTPSNRTDLGALAWMTAVGGLFFVRRSRRSRR
jgi:MYXO-CTERM domain-containing protein